MGYSILENIELINQLGEYIEEIQELKEAAVLELYELNKILTRVVNENIKDYGTEARIVLCRQQEVLLSKLVSFDLNYDNENIKNVYTPAVQGFRQWNRVEFFKDKGLVGYFLGKELNAKHKMFFCSKNDVDNVKLLLPDQEMLISDDEEELIEQYMRLLTKEHQLIDVLILHGMYGETIAYLDEYRKLRPDGKVYCGLDMNSHNLSRIDFSNVSILKFLKQCDVVATSSKYVRDMLNDIIEVNTPCYYLPNGFSNLLNLNINVDVKLKENVILTVGRIGTEQKNNMELLVAFAKVAHLIPDWSVRLVGTIEEGFKPRIEDFFEKFPNLIDRVIFTGAIMDKQMLYDEYAKAKCFALTSTFEGGTPNVYAEALNHGCMFITSDIDAADELTNYGELGYVYELGKVNELSECILDMSRNSSMEYFEEHIVKALAYANENYDWRKNAKKLAIMLDIYK